MYDQYPKETWILVRDGKVQRRGGVTIGDKVGKVWPVARTHEDAKQLIAYWKADGVRPAMVGSIEGEKLEEHVRLAIEDGCIAAICVMGWNDDGSPVWGILNFDK